MLNAGSPAEAGERNGRAHEVELEFPPSPPLWHHLSRVAPDIIGRLKLGSTCFAAVERDVFLYSAHTNAVMTANDDGEAERLRRDWIIDALKFHGMCSDG